MLISSLAERVKLVRRQLGFRSQGDLAEELNIDWQRIQNIERGRIKNLTSEEAIKFEVKLKVCGWWLISGIGDMMLENNSSKNLYHDVGQHQIKILAGTIDKDVLTLDCSVFKEQMPSHHLRAIKMCGDSMQPTLFNNDWLIVDTTKKSSINGLYTIMHKEEFLIQRLTFLIDGNIEISNDNLAYKSQIVHKESIEVIGMASLIIRNC